MKLALILLTAALLANPAARTESIGIIGGADGPTAVYVTEK